MPVASSRPVAGYGVDGAAEHPGVAQLFAVLAGGEILAFERLAKEAELAPDLRGRIAFASMAAAEMAHFETLQGELERRGLEVVAVTEPYLEVLARYHARTTPRNWYEALVKAYIGDGLAADFYTQVLPALPAGAAAVVEETLSGTGHSEFVVPQVRSAVVANPALRSPLTLWGRRLLSEAITQAQEVLATRDELTDMLFASAADVAGIADFFETAQNHHAKRMAALGLG
ncbi:ferritin-like fold-containing protein [Tsukamurella soli]|uniref:ferritin-like fold-containing protein n=1 Tax=Tsukamurella soli TaxID=644556 RepID=UPI003612DAFB